MCEWHSGMSVDEERKCGGAIVSLWGHCELASRQEISTHFKAKVNYIRTAAAAAEAAFWKEHQQTDRQWRGKQCIFALIFSIQEWDAAPGKHQISDIDFNAYTVLEEFYIFTLISHFTKKIRAKKSARVEKSFLTVSDRCDHSKVKLLEKEKKMKTLSLILSVESNWFVSYRFSILIFGLKSQVLFELSIKRIDKSLERFIYVWYVRNETKTKQNSDECKLDLINHSLAFFFCFRALKKRSKIQALK